MNEVIKSTNVFIEQNELHSWIKIDMIRNLIFSELYHLSGKHFAQRLVAQISNMKENIASENKSFYTVKSKIFRVFTRTII